MTGVCRIAASLFIVPPAPMTRSHALIILEVSTGGFRMVTFLIPSKISACSLNLGRIRILAYSFKTSTTGDKTDFLQSVFK